MSSDSEEDIFGNAAKKLKLLCTKYTNASKIDNCEILSDTTTTEIDRIINGETTTSSTSLILLSDDNTDHISEKHAKLKKSDYPSDLSDNSDTEMFMLTHKTAKGKQSCRTSRRVSSKKAVSNKIVKIIELSDSNTNNSPQEGRRMRKKTKKSKAPQDVLSQPLLQRLTVGLNGDQNSSDTNNFAPSLTVVSPDKSKSKGRRGRGGRNRGRKRPQPTSQYPTYNIGNTEEYPDDSEDIPLFSSKPTISNEILISDEDSDENEELTIHVHWQNSEIFKFNIRKFQKIKQVFHFFAEKENVPEKRLFFAYNDVVLTCDDTPDSMKYNIASFIEGGLVSQDLSPVREHTTNKPSGVQIKFQCQNFKKPYEIAVQPDEKLSLAMLKCAEHYEKPLSNLRFVFDGESISGTSTIKELELESGDCIDIRIIK